MNGIRENIEQTPSPISALNSIDLSRYEGVHERSLPLVAGIDYVATKFHLERPGVIEVGPVPTFHYFPGYRTSLSSQPDEYDPNAFKDAEEKDIPPIWYLAERHPEWHMVAISPHGIPAEAKRLLFPNHEDLFMTNLGPERTNGIHTDDAFLPDYQSGKHILDTSYPLLLQRLNGKAPDIIFGRHVFDKQAKGYPVAKLATVAAMLLRPGGFFISHVYGSGPKDSQVPFGTFGIRFPFDDSRNMKHVLTLEFPKGEGNMDHVFVYQKRGDSIRPNHPPRSLVG